MKGESQLALPCWLMTLDKVNFLRTSVRAYGKGRRTFHVNRHGVYFAHTVDSMRKRGLKCDSLKEKQCLQCLYVLY